MAFLTFCTPFFTLLTLPHPSAPFLALLHPSLPFLSHDGTAIVWESKSHYGADISSSSDGNKVSAPCIVFPPCISTHLPLQPLVMTWQDVWM